MLALTVSSLQLMSQVDWAVGTSGLPYIYKAEVLTRQL